MRKKNYKGRCEKRAIRKCKDVCKTYDAIQYAYSKVLEQDKNIKEIQCNVLLDGLEIGEYTSDFVCTTNNDLIIVRECVFKKHLSKPLTISLLDASREYWLKHGVTDWGIIVDE